MILGIGVDIVDKLRIRRLYDLMPDAFVHRILSEDEIEYFYASDFSLSKAVDFIAKRFALKESVSKSIGCGFGSIISFTDVSISYTKMGDPILNMNDRILNAIYEMKKDMFSSFEECALSAKVHVSLSDEKDRTVCFSVLEKFLEK
ncbi:holo-ACP synthase [Rickettsiales bacterium]|nr:holo-ACP synthase [Rickettsiales bacterium]